MSIGDSYYQNIEEVFVCNRGWIRGYLKKYLGNDADADEALQEVFRRYVLRVTGPKKEIIADVRNYLLRIAISVCRNHWRKNTVPIVSFDDVSIRQILNRPSDPEAMLPFDEARLEFQEFEALFPQVWARLTKNFPERQTHLLCMHLRMGISIETIAATMNEDIQTIRRDVNRAQARLHARIKGHLELKRMGELK